MRENPRPFERYKHFKGNLYQIITLAKDSEDGRTLVVYQALYGDYAVYVRDLEQFMSPVDKDKYPDVTQGYRFEKCGETEKREKEEMPVSAAPEEDEFHLDPMVEAFLDTDALDEKLNILAGLQHRITKEMLSTMAVVSDIELNDGSVEEQYKELRDYLLMKEKFECRRTW